jgi:hypothetical protein
MRATVSAHTSLLHFIEVGATSVPPYHELYSVEDSVETRMISRQVSLRHGDQEKPTYEYPFVCCN